MEIGVEAINRGHVDGFLRKPWDNAQLVALVESLVKSRVAAPAPGIATPAPASGGAPGGLDARARAALEAEVQEINKAMQKLRVRLGLGSLSPEGYQKAADELAQRRAELEARLVRL